MFPVSPCSFQTSGYIYIYICNEQGDIEHIALLWWKSNIKLGKSFIAVSLIFYLIKCESLYDQVQDVLDRGRQWMCRGHHSKS